MNNSTVLRVVPLALMCLLASCVNKPTEKLSIYRDHVPQDDPHIPREMRAVWVATVGNIDWPTEPGLSTQQQKEEAIGILNRCSEMNINCVVLQVRTACDALYDSKIEPWSYFLTGKEGKAPSPYYDPLEFWVNESHKRGIELHAWFNPYRARPGGEYVHAANHVSKAKPEVVCKYGKMEWLDPGALGAYEQTYNVFMDVVRRYDIDGVHMDDYFYPYPEADPSDPDKTKELPFPDSKTFAAYQASGGKLALADWRRENVNHLVRGVYEGIKKEKPWVKFGISPFGIWKPGYPQVIEGFSQYEKLYADAKLWLNKGWVDYWTPQIYWKLGSVGQNHLALLNWWAKENTHDRPIYVGNYSGQVGGTWSVDEITAQIGVARASGAAHGNVHFSMRAFMENRADISDTLLDTLYAEPALIPASTWLDGTPPPKPSAHLMKAPKAAATQIVARRARLRSSTTQATTQESEPPRTFRRRFRRGSTTASTTQAADDLPTRSGAIAVNFAASPGEPPFHFAIYTKHDNKLANKWHLHVYPATATEAVLYDEVKLGKIVEMRVTAVDRSGNESAPMVLMRDEALVTKIAARPKAATSRSTQPTTKPATTPVVQPTSTPATRP